MDRRFFIATAPFAAVALAAPAVAAANPSGDAVLEQAWAKRQQAFEAYNAIISDGDTPEELALWAIIDEAEKVIQTTVASTPRGVAIQLWTAMYHTIVMAEEERAVTRGDFDYLDREDGNLDWDARLTLAALRSLKAMEAA